MHRYRGALVAALFLVVVIGLAVAVWPSPSPTGRSGGAHGLTDPAPGSARPRPHHHHATGAPSPLRRRGRDRDVHRSEPAHTGPWRCPGASGADPGDGHPSSDGVARAAPAGRVCPRVELESRRVRDLARYVGGRRVPGGGADLPRLGQHVAGRTDQRLSPTSPRSLVCHHPTPRRYRRTGQSGQDRGGRPFRRGDRHRAAGTEPDVCRPPDPGLPLAVRRDPGRGGGHVECCHPGCAFCRGRHRRRVRPLPSSPTGLRLGRHAQGLRHPRWWRPSPDLHRRHAGRGGHAGRDGHVPQYRFRLEECHVGPDGQRTGTSHRRHYKCQRGPYRHGRTGDRRHPGRRSRLALTRIRSC